jgi:hypothetical protein
MSVCALKEEFDDYIFPNLQTAVAIDSFGV